jgi:hypothetical protein
MYLRKNEMQVILSHDEVLDAIHEYVEKRSLFKAPCTVQIEPVVSGKEITVMITQVEMKGEG